MRFISLLPREAVDHRPRVIHDEHLRGPMTLQVSGRVLATGSEDELIRLTVWSEVFGWAVLVLTDIGDLVAFSVNEKEGDAIAAVLQVAAFKGYDVSASRFRTLQTPRDVAFGDRRSGRLIDSEYDTDAKFQVSAKKIVADESDSFEGPLCQLRIWTATLGWIQVVLNETGDVVAHVVAATEKDAWSAAQAVMRRKGYVTA